MSITDIISIITAVSLVIKIYLDNRNSANSNNVGYLNTLVQNIKNLSEQNLDLQKQVDASRDEIDLLRVELATIKGSRYEIGISLSTGKNPFIDNVSIKGVDV